jgi:hypothetical protein
MQRFLILSVLSITAMTILIHMFKKTMQPGQHSWHKNEAMGYYDYKIIVACLVGEQDFFLFSQSSLLALGPKHPLFNGYYGVLSWI